MPKIDDDDILQEFEDDEHPLQVQFGFEVKYARQDVCPCCLEEILKDEWGLGRLVQSRDDPRMLTWQQRRVR